MALIDEVLGQKVPLNFNNNEKKCRTRCSLLVPINLPSIPKKFKEKVEDRCDE